MRSAIIVLGIVFAAVNSLPSKGGKVAEDEMNAALGRFQELSIAKEDNGETLDVFDRFLYMFDSEMSIQTLQPQFRFIPVYRESSRMLTASAFPINNVKNRYGDVPCFETTRVHLELEEGGKEGVDDYIHANYIKFPETEGTPYIATQAPKPETIDDFFEMVFEQKSDTVVTLANPIEKGRVKGLEYWNPDAISSFKLGRFKSVEVESLEITDYIAKRRFRLVKPIEESHEFTQLHFLDWPDFGVPADVLGFANLWEDVQKTHAPGSPLIVHCSAGIGRAGTFIAIDHLVKLIPSVKSFNPTIVRDTVNEMRKQRFGMVQTLDQYTFIYKVVGSLLKETFSPMRASPSSLEASSASREESKEEHATI